MKVGSDLSVPEAVLSEKWFDGSTQTDDEGLAA